METPYNKGTSYEKYLSHFMLVSLFVDEWNIFAVPMMSIFLAVYYNLSNIELGLITAATVGGASIGSILGGIINDRIGRKKGFYINMGLFIFSAILSIISPTALIFIISRFIAGFPAGSDITNAYSFIMETISPGKREISGSKNTLMASYAILGLNFAILLSLLLHFPYGIIWKIAIGISLIPSCILLGYSGKIKESKLWKSDPKDKKVTYTMFIKKLRKNKTTWNTTLYAWVCGMASGIEVGTFAFFMPYILTSIHVSNIFYSRIIIILIYSFGVPAGIIGPALIPRVGLRRLSYTGFAISFISLMMAGSLLIFRYYILVPLPMILFVIGNHLNNQPIITSQSLVSKTEYRGRAIGLTNFITEIPAFFSITIFPLMFSITGIGFATMIVALSSLAGVLVSVFIFREIYGYRRDIEEVLNN